MAERRLSAQELMEADNNSLTTEELERKLVYLKMPCGWDCGLSLPKDRIKGKPDFSASLEEYRKLNREIANE